MAVVEPVDELRELRTLRDELRKVAYGGVASIRDSSGEEIHYSSPTQLRAAIAELDCRIASLTYSQHTAHAKTSKGV